MNVPRFVALCCAFSLLICSTSHAQLNGTLAKQPIGVGYTRDISQKSMFTYMQKLGKRLEIGTSIPNEGLDEVFEATNAKVKTPINGVAWFMVSGLIPSFKPIYFQQVKDEADAKRMMTGRSKLFGSNGTTKAQDNGGYLISYSNSWNQAIPEGADPNGTLEQIQTQNSGNNSLVVAELVEVDGKQMVKQTWTRKEMYRYHDQLLFSADFEEIFSIDLPTRESLTSQVSIENDLGAEASFDRIPTAIKTLGWNMLSASAGVQMQPRDGENGPQSALRKTSMQVGLDMIKSVMFDIDQLNGFVRFASEQNQSIKAQLTFDTRRNSSLRESLEQLTSAPSRLAPILRDNAATTAHLCFRPTPAAGEVLKAASNWMQYKLAAEFAGDPSINEAAGLIAKTLYELADGQHVEAFVKVGWSEASDGVFYAGLRVGDNPRLLDGLQKLLASDQIPGPKADVQMTDLEGMRMIHVQTPEPFSGEIKKISPLSLTDLYVAHEDSFLWVAMGGPNAKQMIRQSVLKCRESGRAVKAPLFSFDFNPDTWLSYSEDDPTGISGLLIWLDENNESFPPSPMNVAFAGRRLNEKPTALLRTCFDLGGDRNFKLSTIADKDGLQLNIDMGEALGNYYVARMLDSQDRRVRQMRQRQEAAEAKAKDESSD